jgi:hypothetical protein
MLKVQTLGRCNIKETPPRIFTFFPTEFCFRSFPPLFTSCLTSIWKQFSHFPLSCHSLNVLSDEKRGESKVHPVIRSPSRPRFFFIIKSDLQYVFYCQKEAVLRIHEILVRIWIRRSIPLTNGSGSCYVFSPVTFKTSTNFFFTKIFCLLLFKGTFTSSFKDKKL